MKDIFKVTLQIPTLLFAGSLYTEQETCYIVTCMVQRVILRDVEESLLNDGR
jgi:hypothetical protein